MLRNHYCTVCWLASWLDNWLVDCNMYGWLVGTLAVRAAIRVERHLLVTDVERHLLVTDAGCICVCGWLVMKI